MNGKIVINTVLSIVLCGAGIYLIAKEQVFFSDRKNLQEGTLFTGWTFYLLSLFMFDMAAFAIAVARGLLRDEIPFSGLGPIPAFKGSVAQGHIIAKYWYLVVLAITFLVLACMLTERAPIPALHPMLHSCAAELHRYSLSIRNPQFI